MEILRIILNSPVVGILIWAILIFLGFLYIKKPIYELLGRVKSAKLPAGTSIELESQIDIQPSDTEHISKETSIFALGLSIVQVARHIEKGTSNKKILTGLEHCMDLAKKSGLDDYAKTFEQIHKNFQTQTRELSEKDVTLVISNLVSISKEIAAHLNKRRPC